jgi:hypothetical protein
MPRLLLSAWHRYCRLSGMLASVVFAFETTFNRWPVAAVGARGIVFDFTLPCERRSAEKIEREDGAAEYWPIRWHSSYATCLRGIVALKQANGGRRVRGPTNVRHPIRFHPR